MSANPSRVSYPQDGNSLCFAVEDSSFWFRHRNQCILEVMKRFSPRGTVYDVGGGNGYVARALQDAGLDVVLVEPGADGVQNALKRGVRKVVHGTLDDVEVLPGSVAAVCMFDVIEHIANDLGFLQGIHRLMEPRGRIYITVPAYGWLWSHEDCAAGHARRYTLRTLCQTLYAAGYEMEFDTYFLVSYRCRFCCVGHFPTASEFGRHR
jgi:SAM-dependent methyltransferase